MSLPRWTRSLLERLAPPGRADEVVGDLEEVHGGLAARRGRLVASLLTAVEAAEMAGALLRERRRRRRDLAAALSTDAATRRRRLPTVSALDFTLGLRMLARYPSLTAVAVLAMAFGIATGATGFQLAKELMLPPRPFAEPARIVTIRNVDTRTTQSEPRALHDVAIWRGSLRSVERLGVLQLRQHSLGVGEAGSAAPVSEAAVTPGAFGLVNAAPMLGRALLPADEAPGAAPVVVLSHELWKRRFREAPDVVGRVVRLGDVQTTVVGVMPRDFGFFLPDEGMTTPPAQDLWVPFRARALDVQPGEGPAISVFGRLARGATLEGARAELATLAATMAAESPGTHAHLRPELISFARPFDLGGGAVESGMLALSALFLAALMAVVCGNVALLLFARAATRETELAVRNALGASRSRIVAQLFAEALVLAAVAVVVGLAGASVVLRWAVGVMRSLYEAQWVAFPTWIDDRLSPSTIGYAVALALVGAVVAGVLPGLKVTGRRGAATLQRLAGRGSGVRMGGVWTAIVVAQVALTVMLVPIAAALGRQTMQIRSADHRLPADEYLAVRLETDAVEPEASSSNASEARADSAARSFERSYGALARRLEAEPWVTGVTIASQLPGGAHQRPLVELDLPTSAARSAADPHAQVATVDASFFEVMRTPVVAGRGFGAADVATDQRAVVVNESFVRELLGGRQAIGERIRYGNADASDGPAEWHTIVGVVADLAMTVDPNLPHRAGVYHPLLPGATHPVRLAVRVAGEPGAHAGRLHEIAAAVAPELRLTRAMPLDQAARGLLVAHDAWFRVIVIAGAMALLLTNAGIYAVISFIVARRTREIGVRVALGADRRQVVAAIVSRTARHVATGVAIGAAFGVAFTLALSEGAQRPSLLEGVGVVAAYMVVMTAVCLLACVVPTRRALRIEPTEALAAE